MDENEPRIVASYLTDWEAAALVGDLGLLGIKADMWGADSSAVWPELPGNVQVVVRQQDLARAQIAFENRSRRQH
jgi:hypothetical protein